MHLIIFAFRTSVCRLKERERDRERGKKTAIKRVKKKKKANHTVGEDNYYTSTNKKLTKIIFKNSKFNEIKSDQIENGHLQWNNIYGQ